MLLCLCSEVFPSVPITLCIWHVWRAWTKNIVNKVLCPFAKPNINQHLVNIMYSKDLGEKTIFLDLLSLSLFPEFLIVFFSSKYVTLFFSEYCIVFFSDFTAMSEAFLEQWKERELAFVKYYKTEWHKKVCRWAVYF